MNDPTFTTDGRSMDGQVAEDRLRRIEAGMTRLGLGLAHRLGGNRLGREAEGVLFDRLMRSLAERHPRAFAALAELPEARLLIDPQDAPAALMLRVGPSLSLRLCERNEPAEAAVRSPCARLLDLFEGRIDGDALFFRRELVIEGDTALILALRNTLDGEEIDLFAAAAGMAGPLGRALPPARRAAGRLLGLMDGVHRALPEPLERGLAALERRLSGRLSGRLGGA
ncbi:putative lipid carrier protein YhbT [Azospirillum agricola]|uniref:ubiquinone anaerobic biosynthesis accessory factor UbiT n=1 Tax=Azospirillum agricola TaxID=1720247 RepID=UPI001F3B8648|nr:SCP2 sterol-binding domain-containing protein [Azospirillum agricola]MBP2229482.1 putative lipid carrier protein YhbT [Azospirillum agricola]